MPYTGTGRWFPQAWYDEMGVLPVHPDITTEEIAAAELEWRELRERLAREAEEERLRQLALRPPTIERIRAAFAQTLFEARSETIFEERQVENELFTPAVDETEDDDFPDPPGTYRPPQAGTHPEMRPITGYRGIRNMRTNQIMSIMSDEYEIINDIDVATRIAALCDEAQIRIEPERHHVSIGKDGISGRQTFLELAVPDLTILPGTDYTADVRLFISNSFDGSKNNRLILAFRLGDTYFTAFSQHEEFAIRHRTGANDRLAAQLGGFITESMPHNAQCVDILRTNHASSQERVAEYLQENRVLAGERNAERLMGRWMVGGNSLNLWNLYRIFADVITEDYGQNFGSKLARMEMLNSDVRRVWPNALDVQFMLPRI